MFFNKKMITHFYVGFQSTIMNTKVAFFSQRLTVKSIHTKIKCFQFNVCITHVLSFNL